MVNLARLLVYGLSFYALQFVGVEAGMGGLVLAATFSTFLGSFLGKRLLRKVTLRTIQVLVGAILIAVGPGMASGPL